MRFHRRMTGAVVLLLLLPFILNCNVLTEPGGSRSLEDIQALEPAQSAKPVVTQANGGIDGAPQPTLAAGETSAGTPAAGSSGEGLIVGGVQLSLRPSQDGEPAGCLALAAQQRLSTNEQRLAYADQLLGLPHPLSRWLLPENWDGVAHRLVPVEDRVISLSMKDVQNEYWLQRILNALHVAGFVAWLRENAEQGLHILAIPLQGQNETTAWDAYINAYWQDRRSTPPGDETILPALKLPPCNWMIESGLASPVYDGWFYDDGQQPDYVGAAAAYLAETTGQATSVAEKINWLGSEGLEGPNTMCGPLAWSILSDAGAFPPDFGGWSFGPKAFWLARPETNGRPWSLFPREAYHVFVYSEPLGKFDFDGRPLLPGDFLYTYSEKDGFDHMLVVTEVDGAGNVYAVTNLIQVIPVPETTIERVLLLNLNDLTTGLARQGWATDRKNGRTGHSGFDVFRWAWAEKDRLGEAVSYTVQPGDTLGLIAERWKTPAVWIARYNSLVVGEELSIDQVLEIPPNPPDPNNS